MSDSPHANEDSQMDALLSELKNIFNKLTSKPKEKEGETDKTVVPAQPAAPPTPVAATPLIAPPPIAPTPVVPPPVTAPPLITPPPVAPIPVVVPAPVAAPPPITPPSPIAASLPAAATPPTIEASPEIPADTALLDPGTRGVAIAFPTGKEAECEALATKLEALVPKFTKVAFRLAVRYRSAYNPKANLPAGLLEEVRKRKVEAFFFIVDHPFDAARKKSIANRLEPAGIYFHDVPLLAIEKKAFYTDLLLGLVFFFDAQKPPQVQ